MHTCIWLNGFGGVPNHPCSIRIVVAICAPVPRSAEGLRGQHGNRTPVVHTRVEHSRAVQWTCGARPEITCFPERLRLWVTRRWQNMPCNTQEPKVRLCALPQVLDTYGSLPCMRVIQTTRCPELRSRGRHHKCRNQSKTNLQRRLGMDYQRGAHVQHILSYMLTFPGYAFRTWRESCNTLHRGPDIKKRSKWIDFHDRYYARNNMDYMRHSLVLEIAQQLCTLCVLIHRRQSVLIRERYHDSSEMSTMPA